VKRIVFLTLLTTVSICSCKSGKDPMKEENDSRQMREQLRKALPIESIIGVGRCRLVATILSIDTIDKRCLHVPCRARARVVETRGYGSSFGSILVAGQEIDLLFEFGLAPLTKQLANGKLVVTGLTVGESFQADIQGGGGESAGGNAFTVFDYTKK